MPKLVVKHPETGEMSFALTGERITVGRRADNNIQINHGTVSGHHAEIVSVQNHYLLRDLGSTNHCFFNGRAVTELELKTTCKLMIGTIECEFVPDPPVAALATNEVDHLRKTVGMLREQNEELITKLSDQQNQINILGSARLLTPAAGADIESIRNQVKTLTADRIRLQRENDGLRAEVDRLRVLAALNGDTDSLKNTVRLPVPPPPDSGAPTAIVRVSPSGDVSEDAPTVRIVKNAAG